MILLDTNVLSHLQKEDDPVGRVIETHLDQSADRDVRITVVNAFEMMRGAADWVEKRMKAGKAIPEAFNLVAEVAENISQWVGLILPYDDQAHRIYQGFEPWLRQSLKLDARIGAIALRHDAMVWTQNVRDFRRIPGLAVVRADLGHRVE